MSTPFAETPKWFDAEYYLGIKLASLQANDPKGNWTRESMLKSFAEHGVNNPYDHYLLVGDAEGLNPNALFNATEYVAAKVAELGLTYTPESVIEAIHAGGLTIAQHYIQYGSKEGISPSSQFNQDKYYDAKLQSLIAAEPDKGWTLDQVKEAFAANHITPLEHYFTFAKAEGLDKYDYSDNGRPIPHPGNTGIVLTTGTDIVGPDAEDAAFKTSDRDDTIAAVSGTSGKGTLNPADVIDGAGGADVLKVDMQADFGGFTKGGSVKNVETIMLSNASGRTFDAKGVEAANIYVVDGGTANTTIKNVDTANTGFALSQQKGTFKVQFTDAAVKGTADTAHVTLNSVGTDAKAPVTLDVAGTTSTGKVEALNLYAQGTGNFVTLAQGHETVSVSGAANLNVVTAAGLKTFNASTATGNVTAILSNDAATLKTVNGGAGNDTITVAAANLSGTVFNGGAGKDNLIFTVDPTAAAKPVISGFEKITLNAGGSLNGTNITDLTEVLLKSVTGTTDLSKMSGTELIISKEGGSGSTSHVKYDGTGVLTFQNVDSDGTQGAVTAGKLTAISVDTLNIVNNDHEGSGGSLTVSGIDAKAATTLTVNTGDYGVTVNAASDLRMVNSITVNGDGAFSLSAGAHNFGKLASVDASQLKGAFTFDLTGSTVALGSKDSAVSITGAASDANTVRGSDIADHIKFTGGTGTNTIYGGGGADVITLESGSADTVAYAATDATSVVAEGKDHIIGFEAGSAGADVIQFTEGLLVANDGTAIGSGVATGATVNVAVNHYSFNASAAQNYTAAVGSGATAAGVIEIMNVFNDASMNINSATDIATFLKGGVATAAVINSDMAVVFSITDGSDTYLWYMKSGDTALDSSDLSLIGVLEGVKATGAFDTGDFTIMGV